MFTLGNFQSVQSHLEEEGDTNGGPTLIRVNHNNINASRFHDNHHKEEDNMKPSCLSTPPRDDDDDDDDNDDEKEEEKSDLDNINEENYKESKKEEPYFERQKWEMCLLHSLNALYQQPRFTSKDMDEICTKLAPNKIINPHKSVFQTGNYDANVLMSVLESEGVDVQWFDSRKAKNEIKLNDDFLCPDNKYKFLGFILNNPHKRMIVFNRRHWLTIKRIKGIWYNLDSRQKKPMKYASKQEIQKLEDWLIDALVNNDAQLMICRTKKKEKQSHHLNHHHPSISSIASPTSPKCTWNV